MRALVDPWDLEDEACIPDTISLPSFKFSPICRGTFQVGTQGVGFATIDPWLLAYGTQPCVRATTATYAASTFNPALPDIQSFFGNSVFTHVGDTRDYRVVGCGIRIRYAGNELNRGGRIISYRQPNNGNIPGSALDVFLNNLETVTVPVDREWHSSVFKPARAQDISYQNSSVVLTPEYSQLLLITGATPGTTFEFDAICFFEVVGANLPTLTHSHSDPVGMSVVSTALSTHQPTTTPSDDLSSVISSISSIAETALSFVPGIVNTGARALRAAAPLIKAGAPLALALM